MRINKEKDSGALPRLPLLTRVKSKENVYWISTYKNLFTSAPGISQNLFENK